MKNIISKLIFFLSILVGLSSCVDFLDQTPDAVAFSDEEVFTDYDKSQKFVDQLMIPYRYMDDNDLFNTKDRGGFHGKRMYGLRERITDNCIANQQYGWVAINSFRAGSLNNASDDYWSECSDLRFTSIWKGIRVANLSLANIGRITNATEEQKAKILGTAYFFRAHFYFMLLQGWGGMPPVYRPLDPLQNMDLARDSYTVTAQKIAATFDSAAVYLPLVIENSEWGRPSKMAALAYKAKALVWAASPFSNPSGDQKLWLDAAVATGQAIDVAEKSGYYKLIDLANFKKLFVDCNDETLTEVIFGRLYNNMKVDFSPYYAGIKSTDFGSGTFGAESITENLAQSFTWSNGEPVDPTTNEYKTNPYFGTGIAAGGHDKRDPRFYESILFNGATTPQVAAKARTVQIWNKAYDNKGALECVVDAQYKATNGYTFTGYYSWKLFAAAFVTKGTTSLMWNYIRLADLYLYYAEAANRAWGPKAAPQGIPGFTLTAVQSLNKIRTRASMPLYDDASASAWLKVGSVEEFEKKVRNEIRVETCFEEKRLYDLRRWRLMLDPAIQTMYGMYIERTAADKFTYTIVPLADNLNLKWQERHYLFKIPQNDTYLGPNCLQNPGW